MTCNISIIYALSRCCLINSLLRSAARLSNALITNSLTLSANNELTLLYKLLLKLNLRSNSISQEFFLAFEVIVHLVYKCSNSECVTDSATTTFFGSHCKLHTNSSSKDFQPTLKPASFGSPARSLAFIKERVQYGTNLEYWDTSDTTS